MSLPIILGADTIQVGMYITVLAHKPITHERLGNIFGMFDPADSWKGDGSGNGTSVATVQDRSYQGDVLKVEAINYPFVSTRRESEYKHNRTQITLDMRESSLMQLTEDFVRSACPYLFND